MQDNAAKPSPLEEALEALAGIPDAERAPLLAVAEQHFRQVGDLEVLRVIKAYRDQQAQLSMTRPLSA